MAVLPVESQHIKRDGTRDELVDEAKSGCAKHQWPGELAQKVKIKVVYGSVSDRRKTLERTFELGYCWTSNKLVGSEHLK